MSEWTGTSGSGAGDVAACPARAAFPQCRTSGAYADRGVALHRFAQMVTLYPERRAEFLAEIGEEWRHTAEGMNVALALDGVYDVRCEISYAVNVKDRTARLIGTNIDRNYEGHLAACGDAPLGLYDIPMTLDVEGQVDPGGIPIEIDYKSGRSVGEVAEHFQRKMSSAALMFYYGASEAISRIAYIWDDGTIHQEGCEFTLIDAWDTCDQMVVAIDRVVAARAAYARGETLTVYPDRDKQCKYCNAFTVCPYWNNLIIGARVRLEHIAGSTPVTPDEKGKALDYVKDVLKVAKELEDQLKEHAAREPLPIDDTYEFVSAPKAGKAYFDQAAARGLLVTLLGQSGMSETDVMAKLATLNKQGRSYPEVRKRKRLPMTKTVQETK